MLPGGNAAGKGGEALLRLTLFREVGEKRLREKKERRLVNIILYRNDGWEKVTSLSLILYIRGKGELLKKKKKRERARCTSGYMVLWKEGSRYQEKAGEV